MSCTTKHRSKEDEMSEREVSGLIPRVHNERKDSKHGSIIGIAWWSNCTKKLIV